MNLRVIFADILRPGDLRDSVTNQRRRAIIFRLNGLVHSATKDVGTAHIINNGPRRGAEKAKGKTGAQHRRARWLVPRRAPKRVYLRSLPTRN
jgi:hypothetical protein